MSIDFIHVEQEYINERLHQRYKLKNVKYLRLLNSIISNSISEISSDVNGTIQYKNGDSPILTKSPFLYYNYGSPVPFMAKILPEGYGWNYFAPNDIYKYVNQEHNIQSKLYKVYKTGKLTRYTQPKIPSDIKIPEKYILVIMQNTGSTVWYHNNFTELSNDIIAWSRENKRNVLFKWHNGCIDHNLPNTWWNDLKEKSKYAHFDCILPLPYLIDNSCCEMVWTASSMAGIEALICNKPVSIFGQTEYMEMSTICDSPENAINTKIPNDLEQWLTYYFRYYCLNMYSNNAKEILTKKLINFFEKGCNITEYVLGT